MKSLQCFSQYRAENHDACPVEMPAQRTGAVAKWADSVSWTEAQRNWPRIRCSCQCHQSVAALSEEERP